MSEIQKELELGIASNFNMISYKIRLTSMIKKSSLMIESEE